MAGFAADVGDDSVGACSVRVAGVSSRVGCGLGGPAADVADGTALGVLSSHGAGGGVGRDAVGVDDGATLGVIAITRHGLGCVMGSATADVAHGAAPLGRVVAIISHAVGVDDGTALGLIAVASHSAGRGIHSTLGVDDGATLGILLVSSHSGAGVGHDGFVKVSAVTMGGNVRGHREQDG